MTQATRQISLRLTRCLAHLIVVLSALLTQVPDLHAQSSAGESWVAIPSVVGETGDPAHVTRRVAEQLSAELAAHNARSIGSQASKRLFEQRGSAPPMLANTSDIDALARDAQQALYHVASGLHAHAKQDVERAMERARRALESLNRETRAAQHLLDACLYLVRGHLGRSDRSEAQRQALDCKRLVPDIEPEPTMHPPAVIGVLAEAEAALLAREPSSLRIESEPMGCAAFVNGRNLGTTPKELPRLSPGEYRVQVECHEGEPGRVHRVVLSNNRAVIRVDTRFDRVVQTLFDLSMRYQDAAEEASLHRKYALEAARVVGASDLLSVRLTELGAPSSPIIEAQRYRVADGKLLAAVRLPLQADGRAQKEPLRTAVRALLRQEFLDLSGSEPLAYSPESWGRPAAPPAAVSAAPAVHALDAPRAAEHVASAPSAKRSPRAMHITGYSLGALGLAANLTGWGLQIRLGALDYVDAMSVQSPGRFQAYREVEDFAIAPPVTLGVGAALLSASMPMWLPARKGVPWWAWVSGGIGVASAGVGVKFAVDRRNCTVDELGRCTEPALATSIGTQLLVQSAPFLTLPVVYGMRALLGNRATGQLDVRSARGGMLLMWTNAL